MNGVVLFVGRICIPIAIHSKLIGFVFYLYYFCVCEIYSSCISCPCITYDVLTIKCRSVVEWLRLLLVLLLLVEETLLQSLLRFWRFPTAFLNAPLELLASANDMSADDMSNHVTSHK